MRLQHGAAERVSYARRLPRGAGGAPWARGFGCWARAACARRSNPGACRRRSCWSRSRVPSVPRSWRGLESSATRVRAGLVLVLGAIATPHAPPPSSAAELASSCCAVTPFSSADEAAAYLASPAGQAIEVLLAEVRGPCSCCARAVAELQRATLLGWNGSGPGGPGLLCNDGPSAIEQSPRLP